MGILKGPLMFETYLGGLAPLWCVWLYWRHSDVFSFSIPVTSVKIKCLTQNPTNSNRVLNLFKLVSRVCLMCVEVIVNVFEAVKLAKLLTFNCIDLN